MATERRVRTKWIMRERYRRIANIVALVGLAAGVAILALIWPHEAGAWLERKFLLTASLIVLLTAMGPPLLVKALWRMVHWRNFEEWS
jgi:hypothetical protein